MNKVILMGRLTRDPEIRYSQNGDQMCIARYTLAVDLTKIEGTLTTITNVHQPELVDISGEKKWVDKYFDTEDYYGRRPASIKVTLYYEGTEEVARYQDGRKVETLTVTADNDWKFGWKDLPKYKDGELIKYTVGEESIKLYKGMLSTGEDGYTFTLTNEFTPEFTSVNVVKNWNDDNNQDGVAEAIERKM